MRMSKKMRELRNQIQEKSTALRLAVDEGNAETAKRLKNEIEELCELHDAALAEFEARRDFERENGDGGDDGDAKYNAELFYKAIAHKDLSEAENRVIANSRKEYANRFSEGSSKDGGITVPDDLSSEIFSAIESCESVRSLVYVENVNSAHGTRIFRDGEPIKLYNTAEYDEIKEMTNRRYSTLAYNQKKFAGLMTVSSELLEDSFVSFKNEFTEWMADAARNTENAQVLYGAGGEKHCQGLLSTAGAYKELACDTLSIDLLRKVYMTLNQGYRANGKWIMNSLAFAAISELKYEDGRSIVQPDPRGADGHMLFGYPIAIFDTIETDEDNKTVIAFGDFNRAYRMFARRDFGVSFTDIGAGAFETDSVKAKGTERFDGKIFDRNAAIIVRNVPVTGLSLTGGDEDIPSELSEATLKNLTKKQLVELAGELGVSGVSSEQTKDNIVSAILAE